MFPRRSRVCHELKIHIFCGGSSWQLSLFETGVSFMRLGFHSWDWGFIHVPIVVKSIDWFWEEKIFDHCIFAHVLFWLLIRSTRPANDKIYLHNEISIYFSFVYINFCCLCSCQSFRQQGTVETWCKRDEEFSRHLNLKLTLHNRE